MSIEMKEDGTIEVVDEGVVEIQDDDVIKKPRGVIVTKVMDDYIVYCNQKDLFFTTNEIGNEIMKHCDNCTFEELMKTLLDVFEGDKETITKSVRNHVGLLASIGLLEVERLEYLKEDSFTNPK
ncbi:MAG: PqqD family protein [Theionarchaea archaeon]|nr:MAG: hypothetical protein AYK18_00570 [Theionarchaea archaeon DG-70]MBU7010374.1 PqqD family protein [Theionarchaea archaeon]